MARKATAARSSPRRPARKTQKTISVTKKIPLASARVTTAPIQPVPNTRVSHEEFFETLSGNSSATFADGLWSFPINPGLDNIFPWLSSIGKNYERYKFEKLDFIFESSCAATSAGYVVMAVETDPSDPDPTDLRKLMAYAGRVRTQIYQSATLRAGPVVRPRQKLDSLCTRVGLNPAGTDLKTYDVGRLLVYVHGLTDADTIGTLSVSYTVTFETAQPKDDTQSGAVKTPTKTDGANLSLVGGSISTAINEQQILRLFDNIVDNLDGLLELFPFRAAPTISKAVGLEPVSNGFRFGHDWYGDVVLNYAGVFTKSAGADSYWTVTPVVPTGFSSEANALHASHNLWGVSQFDSTDWPGACLGVPTQVFPMVKSSIDSCTWERLENFQSVYPTIRKDSGEPFVRLGHVPGEDMHTYTVVLNGIGQNATTTPLPYAFYGCARVRVKAIAGDLFSPALDFSVNHTSGSGIEKIYVGPFWANDYGFSHGFTPVFSEADAPPSWVQPASVEAFAVEALPPNIPCPGGDNPCASGSTGSGLGQPYPTFNVGVRAPKPVRS